MAGPEPPVGVAEALGLVVCGWTPVSSGWGGNELWRLRIATAPGHGADDGTDDGTDDGSADDLLLRLFPYPIPALAERERAAHDFARSSGVPAPEVYAAGRFGGRTALLTAWVDAPTVAQRLLADPSLAVAAGRSTGALLARLHAADPAGIGTRLRPDGWLEWAGRADGDPPAGERVSVLHLDAHPSNLLAAASGEVVAAVDWANARLGPPAADLARTRVTLDFAAVLPAWSALAPAIGTYWDGLLDGYGGLPVGGRRWAWYLEWARAVQRIELAERPAASGRDA